MPEASAAQTLLEREGEVEGLVAAISSAAEGRGSAVLIEGAAGIGKSELLALARSRAAERGMEVLAARGGELERSFGFGVARQLFEPRLADADAAERRALLQGPAALAARAVLLDQAEGEGRQQAVPLGDPAGPVQHGLLWLLANLAES